MSSPEDYPEDYNYSDDDIIIDSTDDEVMVIDSSDEADSPAGSPEAAPDDAFLNFIRRQQQETPARGPPVTFGQHLSHLFGNADDDGYPSTPAGAFRKTYQAFSTAIYEVQHGREARDNVMYGGKILMPPSALDELTRHNIEFPVTFEISSAKDAALTTHVGVLEFVADEGTVNLPQWVMDQLRLGEGDRISIQGARYPKGKFIKIQPQSVDFLEVSDPKAVLEKALRDYSCLSKDDIIEISYHALKFRLHIKTIQPEGPAISVLDTDIEVDFDAPLGYVEPERPAARGPEPTMRERFAIDTTATEDIRAGSGPGTGAQTPASTGMSTSNAASLANASAHAWEAFKGSGVNLNGKKIKGKGIKARKPEAVEDASKITRTDQQRYATINTPLHDREVPAALNLPFGHLFFDFAEKAPPAEVAEGKENGVEPKAEPVPFKGAGHSLR